MSKTFIHVGLPKTATTFFQQQIFPNLARTTCIARPYTQQNYALKKLQYADNSLYDPQEVKTEIEKIKGDRTILSDECFVGNRYLHFINRTIIAERFSQIFPEAEIIIFLRGQKDILASIYNQAIKAGRTILPVEDFIWQTQKYSANNSSDSANNVWDSNMTYFNSGNHRINLEFYLYYELIEMYHRLYKKVHIFLYEDFKNNPQNVIKNLLLILDDKLTEVDENILNRRINYKIEPQRLEAKRLENQVKQLSLANNKYISKALTLIYISLNSLFNAQANQPISKEYINSLVGDFYRQNNQKLIKKYSHVPLGKYPQSYQLS